MSSSPPPAPTLGDVESGFSRVVCADSPFTATHAKLVTGSHVVPALSVPNTFRTAVATSLEVEGSGIVVLEPHERAHGHLVELAGVGATANSGVGELVTMMGDGEVCPQR
jgi:hypothetical protein